LSFTTDPNLLTSVERAEDAGVYKLSDELALIQTVDFFTPIVDDPFTFGQIAAVNALSDVYAMGGRPLTAMNIVCFPKKTMEISILQEVLAGGLDKVHEAGVILVGGHSVEGPELKYGLSVTGIIHPKKVVYNHGAKAGDRLILTKPLGTGIITTAIKGDMANDIAIKKVVSSMSALNRHASELMQQIGVHACTDVTGFGLLGHAAEMIEGTDVGMVLHTSQIPFFSEAKELAGMGLVPGGTQRNREFRLHMVNIPPEVPGYMSDILFDPQTSGGLLIAVEDGKADKLLNLLQEKGVEEAAIIGEVTGDSPGMIQVR